MLLLAESGLNEMHCTPIDAHFKKIKPIYHIFQYILEIQSFFLIFLAQTYSGKAE
jgi:hypothetical protein